MTKLLGLAVIVMICAGAAGVQIVEYDSESDYDAESYLPDVHYPLDVPTPKPTEATKSCPAECQSKKRHTVFLKRYK